MPAIRWKKSQANQAIYEEQFERSRQPLESELNLTQVEEPSTRQSRTDSPLILCLIETTPATASIRKQQRKLRVNLRPALFFCSKAGHQWPELLETLLPYSDRLAD